MTGKVTGRGLSACAAVLVSMALGGCFGVSDHPVASADAVDLQAPVATADAQPPIRTVRRSGRQVADAGDLVPHGSALPTPSQIFDFHPPGSKPDSWRAPFIIDPNDGPLAGYVRRMDAELTESNRQTKTAEQVPVRKKVCPSGRAGGDDRDELRRKRRREITRPVITALRSGQRSG